MVRAIIESVVEFGDRTQVVATLLDEDTQTKVSTGEVFFPANAPLETVKAALRARVATSQGTPLVKVLPLGEIDLTPPVVEPPKDPTPEELAKAEALRDRFRLTQLKAEVDLGIRKPDNPEYAALVTKLTKAVDDGVLDAVAIAAEAVVP